MHRIISINNERLKTIWFDLALRAHDRTPWRCALNFVLVSIFRSDLKSPNYNLDLKNHKWNRFIKHRRLYSNGWCVMPVLTLNLVFSLFSNSNKKKYFILVVETAACIPSICNYIESNAANWQRAHAVRPFNCLDTSVVLRRSNGFSLALLFINVDEYLQWPSKYSADDICLQFQMLQTLLWAQVYTKTIQALQTQCQLLMFG